jgi:hypothetical protein
MSKQITVYTLAELKAQFPEAYKRVHKKWSDDCLRDEIPWADETMESYNQVVKQFGGKLAKWSIGAYSRSSATVTGVDSDEWSAERVRDEVLAPLGYVVNGKVTFPGLCKLTDYCADDSFLEAVWNDVEAGVGLRTALEDLATLAGKMMEDDLKQQQNEESMDSNLDGCWYTKDGTRAE